MAQIGDILAKLGRGETLTPSEQQQIRLWGNNTEFNNAYIAGLQNGTSNIVASKIDANIIQIKNDILSGYAIKAYRDTDQSVATSTNTFIEWEALEYSTFPPTAIDLVSSPDKIYIPISGRYVVGVNVAMSAIASGFWRIDITRNGTLFASGTATTATGFAALNYPEDVYLQAGDYIGCKMWQNSGGTLDMLGSNIYIRHVGSA